MSDTKHVKLIGLEASEKRISIDNARIELENLKQQYELKEPDRGTTMNDDGIKWRTTAPDYTIANLAYMKGKTMNHAAGSLEELVENTVKTWEFEASHKVDLSQWTTINKDLYKVSCNGGPFVKGEVSKNIGNYNWLLKGCPARLWDSEKMDFDTSHHLFRTALGSGFPWEVISVLSGPPVIVFSWRHWATFSGVYKCPVTGVENQGTGQLIELFGMARVELDKDLKICSLEIFYKPDEFLEVMKGVREPEDLYRGTCLVGPGAENAVLREMTNVEEWLMPWSCIVIAFLFGLCSVFAVLYFTK